MWCCVPCCKTTTEIVSGSEGITFHEFPSDVHLRATWLRAVGKQDYHPLDTAVVCSLHFLSDDFYATESGSRQIRAGAIPSIVQVCLICFDTQSKLYPMSKYKLDEAYQHLVGQPLCDLGNLNQTLCVQCAQRLVNFNKFRDKSLRARSLMLELVEKHELITIQHIKSISRVKHKLRSDIMKTFLGPDQFDVYIAHSDTDTQTKLDASAEALAMEHVKSDSMWVDAVQSLPMTVTSAGSDAYSCNASFAYKEEYLSDDSNPSEVKQMSDPLTTTSSLCETTAETLAPAKQEVTFACTTCLEEFADEDMYTHHTLMHTEDIGNPDKDSVADCSPSSVAAVVSTLKTDQESTEHPTDEKVEVETIAPLLEGLATKHENEVHPTDTNDELDILLFEDNTPQITMLQPDKSLAKLSNSDINFDTTSGNELFNIKQSVSGFGKIEKKTSPESQQKQYICDVCQKRYKRKCFLINHVKSHTSIKILLTCKFCKYQCKSNSILVRHMRTHTGEKPLVCKLCGNKCRDNRSLLRHMRTHTGEKPIVCKVCNNQFKQAEHLVKHMKTHTGEKPYACELCDYKCEVRRNLVLHLRTHTGENPYACELCDYKCGVRRNLVLHMRTHTGEKPYFCELCDYKCAQKSSLVLHMRTHTGEKPYACELCDYKCTVRGSLVQHMRTHTGEKPFTCENCKYKFSSYSNLVLHMRTHTGEKPYACELCDYKCGIRRNLVIHMRTHTGEKPYACELCDYKCRVRGYLVLHMRTHTGVKPYFCESCDYKCKQKSNLVLHRRTHTGEKPFTCENCKYKCSSYSKLVMHMRAHTGDKRLVCK